MRSISADGDVADLQLIERWTVGNEVIDVPRLLRFGVRHGQIASCSVVELEPERVDRLIG